MPKTATAKTTKVTSNTKKNKGTTRVKAAPAKTAVDAVKKSPKSKSYAGLPLIDATKLNRSEQYEYWKEQYQKDTGCADEEILPKKVYEAVGEANWNLAIRQLLKTGEVVVNGFFKIVKVDVPAKKMPAIKAGTMVRNPRTGKEEKHAGRAAFTKPATVRFRVRVLGRFKNLVLA